MSYQVSDTQESDTISHEYHELANKCILLKNRKNLLEDWMKNVDDIQKIEEGGKQIAEIDTELSLLETKLKNHAYMETNEYKRTNEHLQEIKDHADKQKLDAARQRALLNKEKDTQTAKFYEDYKDYKGYKGNTTTGGSKSRRRHRRHRKHARKTRHKRKHRSRAARKYKKYSRRR
jgi:hypothetical protein